MNLLATSSNCYLSFALAASMQVATAAGQLVYDNGVGGPAGVTTSLVADSSLPQAVADGVSFASDQPVVRIEWTGVHAGGDSLPAPGDNFVINIRSDAAGSPGPIIVTFPVGNNANRTALPPGASVLSNLYSYAADISFTFLGGVDYWIEIDNDNGARDDDRAGDVFFDFDTILDLAGNDRYVDDPGIPGAFVDLGAYEFQGVTCLPDVNGDGIVNPADFNAWVIAFNDGSPLADQNRDGEVSPDDFNAWVLNSNAGCP